MRDITITWQGTPISIEELGARIKELSARELVDAYDDYRDEAADCADGDLYIILEALYEEIIGRMEK